MKRVLTIDLDYDLADLAKGQAPGAPKIPSNPEITRNIIENAYAQNHPKMKVKVAKVWRRVVKAIEKAMERKEPFVTLSNDDFKSLQSEIEACEYDHRQAFVVPVLAEELDRIAALSEKESAEIIKSLEATTVANEQAKNVLEMSKQAK